MKVELKKGHKITVNIFGKKQYCKIEAISILDDYSGLIVKFERPIKKIQDRRKSGR